MYTILDHLSTLPKQSVQLQFDYIRNSLGLSRKTFSMESLEETKLFVKQNKQHDLTTMSLVGLNQSVESIFDRIQSEYQKFHLEISTEDQQKDPSFFQKAKEKFKKLLAFIGEQFKKLKHFFSTVFKNIWKSKQKPLKEKHEFAEEVIKKTDLSDDETTAFREKLVKSSFTIQPSLCYMFDKQGNFYPITSIIAEVNKHFEEALKSDHQMDESDPETMYSYMISDATVSQGVPFEKEIYQTVSKHTEAIINEDYVKYIQLDRLKQNFNQLEKFHQLAEQSFKRNSEKLDRLLKEAQRKVDDFDLKSIEDSKEKHKEYIRLKYTFNSYNNLLKLIYLPVNQVLSYMRISNAICQEITSDQYLTTDEIPYQKLYHVSINDKLESPIKPKLGGGYINESLPPRISFAPGVLECVIDNPKYFPENYQSNKDRNEVKSVDLHLYEAIIEPGVTRCIKPELMIFHLNGSQGYLSKEVALTTPTKIKYLGPVRIFYKPAMPQRSKERFIRYEMIESSQG